MRTASFVLGLVGGILGILAAILAMFIGGVGSAFEASDSDSIIGLGFSALLASVLGIVGAALVKGKPKVGSLLMFIAGIWGIISISAFYVVSGILLIIAAIIGLFIKNHQVDLNPDQQM